MKSIYRGAVTDFVRWCEAQALQQLKDEAILSHDNIIRQTKHLNNIVEQDYRFMKKITNPMPGFKSFQTAEITLQGIKAMHMKSFSGGKGRWRIIGDTDEHYLLPQSLTINFEYKNYFARCPKFLYYLCENKSPVMTGFPSSRDSTLGSNSIPIQGQY